MIDERDRQAGQILPLAIGYSAVAAAVIFVCVAISSLYLTEKRLFALADSTALAAADSFRPDVTGGPHVELTDAGVRRSAHEYLRNVHAADRFDRLQTAADSPDGASARVTLTVSWTPPLLSVFVPAVSSVSVTSLARGGLRLGPDD